MRVANPDRAREVEIAASLIVPAPPEALYEAVRDVRRFPLWAPGVRRVEVCGNPGEPGMLSEWEVSFLGLRRKILSVLEEAESPSLLRWSYAGPVTGTGECAIRDRGDGALAEFRTSLGSVDPLLRRLVGSASVRSAASGHLRRSLSKLGHLVCGDESRVLVGPPTGLT
ncbi:MAG: SRPBCC family protein [Actinomycetota bacterium]